jgi:hypothetical protein
MVQAGSEAIVLCEEGPQERVAVIEPGRVAVAQPMHQPVQPREIDQPVSGDLIALCDQAVAKLGIASEQGAEVGVPGVEAGWMACAAREQAGEDRIRSAERGGQTCRSRSMDCFGLVSFARWRGQEISASGAGCEQRR